jgi:hypothetical protein
VIINVCLVPRINQCLASEQVKEASLGLLKLEDGLLIAHSGR